MAPTKGGFESIDEYIAGFPEDVQAKLTEMRKTISQAAPQATERIAYQIPTFYLNGNLVHFAGFERHIGFYPTPGGIVAFQAELTAYKTSKGAIQFPMDEPPPLDLVRRIVEFRVAENSKKPAKKKR